MSASIPKGQPTRTARPKAAPGQPPVAAEHPCGPFLEGSGNARQVTVHEAKTHLSRLLADVEAGAVIVVTRRGKPVATLQRVISRPKRVFGSMKGLISMDERFFEPLPEEELRAWEGGD